mgnify:CR=1 FL=1
MSTPKRERPENTVAGTGIESGKPVKDVSAGWDTRRQDGYDR